MNRNHQSWPWWRRLLTGLSALALALSAYLGWHYLMGGSMIGCGGESSCDDILNSQWSTIAGVLPVSGLAAGVYLAMLAASFFIGPSVEPAVRRLAWRAMLVLAGAIGGSAVWFIILQEKVFKTFCPYCMATHITGLVLAALVIWQARKEFANRMIGPTLAGMVLAGILAACQVVFVPPPAYRSGQSQENLPALDPHTVPSLGSPDAPYVITLFFDYNCPHCQQLHFMLEEVARRYGGKLAIIVCPAPLNTHCNPYVPRDVDEFKDSCDLAKIALAVWMADHTAFPEFDRWMFSFDTGDVWHPRSLDAARAKAIELVGQTKFDAALKDPWIGSYMQTSISLYGETGGNGLPKLLYGSRWVIPQPNDVDDLMSILHNDLGLPNP